MHVFGRCYPDQQEVGIPVKLMFLAIGEVFSRRE